MITSLVKRFLKIAWFLPGFLLWAAFPPMGEKADVLFALAPLMVFARRGLPRASAINWFKSGIFYWIATLTWMPAIVKNGGPWPLVVLGWLALALYCAAYFAAYGWLSAAYWRWASQGEAQEGKRTEYRITALRLLGVLIVEPVLWCGLELVRSRFLGGFAWNQLGVVPVNGGFAAPAAVGGVYLLSAVVILINGTVAGIIERLIASFRRRPVSRLRIFETLGAFALVFAIFSIPSGTAQNESAAPVKVALVQRNFPCVFQGRRENPVEIYGKLLENIAPLSPDLMVLPESAFAEIGPLDSANAVRFAGWLRENANATAVIAGGGHVDAEERAYNSAALYADDGGGRSSLEPQIYDKVHLVPFGEFIPGDKLIPFLQRLAPVGSCWPGEIKTLALPNGTKIGCAICFEDTDSALMRAMAAKGAQMLVFITNDSWFSKSNETRQHAWQAVARAVETGLPVVRVGNSGVTGTISADGKASWMIGPDGRERVDCRGTMCDRVTPVSPSAPKTWYVRLGDVPLFTLFLLLILAMILIKFKNYYEKRRTLSL